MKPSEKSRKSKEVSSNSKTSSTSAKSPTSLIDQAISAIAPLMVEDDAPAFKAMMGVDGHAQLQLGSDGEISRSLQGHLKAEMARWSGRQPLKLEICDDAGVSPIENPKMCVLRILDQAEKLGSLIGFQGYGFVSISACRDIPTLGQHSIVITARMVGFVDNGIEIADLRKQICKSGIVSTLMVPTIKVAKFSAANLDKTVLWSTTKSRMPIHLEIDEDGSRKWSNDSQAHQPVMALRLIEALSMLEIGQMIEGIGKEGKTLIRKVRSSVTSAHKGRVNSGTILQVGTDIWTLWARHWASQNNGLLPYRTDIPLQFGRVASLNKVHKRTSATPSAKQKRAQKDKRKRLQTRTPKPEED